MLFANKLLGNVSSDIHSLKQSLNWSASTLLVNKLLGILFNFLHSLNTFTKSVANILLENKLSSIRIETDILENVRKIVNENNLVSINEFINESLKFAIKNMKVMEDDSDI